LSDTPITSAAAAGPLQQTRVGAGPLGMAFQIRAEPDGRRRFTYLSPTCEALNGIPAEAALADASRLYDLILPEHLPRMMQAEEVALASGAAFDIEVPFRRPDGEVRWHRITSAPRQGDDGAVLWDGMQIDVTDKKQVEAELEENRRRLELAVEATGLGFWEYHPTSGLMSWSERTKALCGLPAEAEVDLPRFLAAVHPDDRARMGAEYEAALAQPGGGDFAFEHRVVTPGGITRWLLTHGRVLTGGDGEPVVVGTCLDVTERRLVEERRTLIMRELAHRARNGLAVMMAILNQTAPTAASVEEFAATVSARLQAMAASQALITDSNGRQVNLASLLKAVLEPFDAGRFDIDEALQDIGLSNDSALGLALLAHELATNALKYGALSNSSGKVLIRRLPTPSGHAAVAWREVGGPPVAGASRTGFGTRLFQAALRGQGGRVEGRFEPDGFTAKLEFPTPAA
jgi:PAS domain S-box-containing protein